MSSSWFWTEESSLDLHHRILLKQVWLFRYRVACAIFHIFLYIWNIDVSKTWYRPFFFLTCWGYMICGIFFILAVLEYLYAKKMKESYKDVSRSAGLDTLSRITIVVFQICWSLQLTIIILFWLIVFPTQKRNPDYRMSPFTLVTHGGVFLLIYIDFVFNKIRFYIRHMVFILIFVLCYGLNNYIITTSTGIPIYGALTWRSLKSYLFIVGAIVITFAHFIFGWFIFVRAKEGRREKDFTQSTIFAPLKHYRQSNQCFFMDIQQIRCITLRCNAQTLYPLIYSCLLYTSPSPRDQA
eukprot:TRINITY_DN7555_c0_g1_i2.p1 TRINITY_DN7555_c0_g1~~TRINITY_DN7555_c0_g1_i2.p1  ORF type:complete len:296 (+),score=31.33 TRINITY_DN7555_c0_g1_i2:156-1043(+)